MDGVLTVNNKKIPFHTCTNDRGQVLEIYSHFCENFYRVAGYHSDGRVLFDGYGKGEQISYWEVNAVVIRFTGKDIRHHNRPPKKDKKAAREALESQTSVILESPIHAPIKDNREPGKALTQKQLEEQCNNLLRVI